MSLTQKEFLALAAAINRDLEELYAVEERAFAAGIAHERARCAKVCRNLEQQYRYTAQEREDQATWCEADGMATCAVAIEAPADGGQPEESQ